MTPVVHWTEVDAEYIGTRSRRYPAAADTAVEWVDEAVADVNALILDPDSRSRRGSVRVVGYSAGAGFVITVIVDRVGDELWGNNAWKTSGRDRRAYREAIERG